MNKSLALISILFILSHVFSCNKYRYNDVRKFSLADITERKQLKGEIIELDEIFMPVRLYIKDSLLFTINNRDRYFVSVFHLKEMKKIGDFIGFGNGPNEVLEVSSIQFQDSLVWVLDQNRQQINKYQLNQFLEDNEVIPLERIKIEDAFEKALVSHNKLIINSLRYIQSRFSFYDLQGNFLENKGDLPDAGVKLTDLELFESFFCNMALNPSDESIFVAYMNTDLIEIYDANGNLKIRMFGPDHFYSIKKQKSSGNEYMVRSIEGETRDAYFSPVAFEDEIWTIYNGKYFDRTIRNDLNNRIILFDWNGNPIREYTTDISFFSLAVDRQNSVFYGITFSPEYAFVKFNYSNK